MSDQPDDAVRLLSERMPGRVDAGARRRAEYSSDASNYRVVPAAVIFPAQDDDLGYAVEVARRTGLSITARGAGTSVAGNAVGPGLILDFRRYFNALLDLDPEARTATVQPGLVLAELQLAAAPHGLRFGPDPSTQSRCTLGGMLGNNACGPRAIRWGRTSDNSRQIRIIDGAGRDLDLGRGSDPPPELAGFADARLALLRTEFGRFSRQGSGYALEHLLPERGRDLAKAFVGTQGSCGLILAATVDLVEIPPATALLVHGYPDIAAAAEGAAAVRTENPTAVEAMDAHLVEVVRTHRGKSAVPELPAGRAWLFVETAGSTPAEAVAEAGRLALLAGPGAYRVLPDGPESQALWRIRQDGVGLAGRTAEGAPAWPGWEDAAVPPDRLAPYLRDFDQLKTAHGLSGLTYGHFGDGCVHTRLDLPLTGAPQRFRSFLFDAARLVVAHGGSLSGEHGDGRARGELLPLMYSPEAISAFAAFKAAFDPDDLLNPGVGVRPAALDQNLRLAVAAPHRLSLPTLVADAGDLSIAAHRCVGIGKCVAAATDAVGFMCPSYLASGDEKDSTRGRARVLQEMMNGTLITAGARSAEVAESLDLCLSCKACASDCPAGVDMATYKSAVLSERYSGRLRPRSHYTLGALPRWLKGATLAPAAANRLVGNAPLRRLTLFAAGIDGRRQLPKLSRQSFRHWWKGLSASRPPASATEPAQPEVVLFVDTFTNAFDAGIGRAAVAVLTDLGYLVRVPDEPVCCGLTFITTGQLHTARGKLSGALDQLAPHVRAGRSIIGLEPSCTAVLRSDLLDLLPDDPRARAVADATFTIAEFLEREAIPAPRLDGLDILVQQHCHQHAVLGFDAERELLRSAGAVVTEIAGCCGLAGNFGMELGHYDLSVAIAELALVPALRARGGAGEFLADGFSCRTQAFQLAGRRGRHLVQLLADHLPPGK